MKPVQLKKRPSSKTARLVAALAMSSLGLITTAHAQSAAFTLSSPDLASGSFDNKFILNGFGCTGGNVSPALEWRNVPAGTKSLSLQIHDPDAPTGSGFWHWGVYNMPPTTTGMPQGGGNSPATLDTVAPGDNGNYGGPCPPVGDKPHRYVFTLYALAVDDVQKAGGIPKTGTAALYSFVLNKGIGANLLGKASFTATYGR